MRPSLLPPPLLALLLATASAQQIVDDLSFGHKGAISDSSRTIPNFAIKSTNRYPVQILSDRVILTPPVPGNVQASLWSEKSVQTETWSADLEFRASGQDGGSGNLNLWFVRDKGAVGESSVYNIGNFDGLALVVDGYGIHGGSVRGFLNDGSQNYANKGNQEQLAFGHCDYQYRNLGRPSKLTVTSNDGLTVSIDDQPCFSSPQIQLPAGYYFGVTARTAENPDSFEVHKFAVANSIPHEHKNVVKGVPGGPPQNQRNDGNQQPQNPPPQLQKLDASHFPGAPEALPDSDPEEYKSSEAQFADLHNRLQGLTHQLANMFGEFNNLDRRINERHLEVLGKMPERVPDTNGKIDQIGRRLENLERTVEGIKRSVEGGSGAGASSGGSGGSAGMNEVKEQLRQVREAVAGLKGGLVEGVSGDIGNLISASAPRMGMFVFVVVAVQVMMAGAYIVYKKRRNSMPKKYL